MNLKKMFYKILFYVIIYVVYGKKKNKKEIGGVLLVNKPIVLMPFILVYRLVSLPIKLIKYISLGLFFVGFFGIKLITNFSISFVAYILKGFVFICYLIYLIVNKTFINFIVHVFIGFVTISYLVYRFIKLIIYGFIFPFVLIYNGVASSVVAMRIASQKKKDVRNQKRELKLREKREKEELNKKRRLERIEEKKKKKEEQIEEKKKKKAKQKEEYIIKDIKLERKSFKDQIIDFFKGINNFPNNLKKFFKEKYESNALVKYFKNKSAIKYQALLIDFEGEDAVKSDVKVMYEYVGKNPEGKIVKGYFEAFSKVEVHSFLLSEGYEVYSIRTNKWIQFLHGRSRMSNVKIKTKDLIFFLTQLSTYIKSGVTLVDSLRILAKQYENKASYKRVFRAIIYDLTMGNSFSDALAKQGNAFPRLLINMVKGAEMTGELPEALDDMAEYYTQAEATRKQMVTALMYPTIIFVISVAVITFIMVFVIPKFVEIYSSMGSEQIPAFTRFVVSVSDFLEKNLIWFILGFILVIIIIRYLYVNVKIFRTFTQWILMHTPVVKNVIIYNEVTMFTKTFASLLSHNVFITDSMEILNKITNNEIYKMLILDTITNLARGEKISEAFKNNWAFPIPAYEMLVTGEKTGQLAEMMQKVSTYYQELHKNTVTRIKTFVEPVLIIFLTVVVGGIILSIIIPMFNIYTSIQQP